MSLSDLTAAVDKLCEVDTHELGHTETVRDLHRLQARLDAVTTRAAAAYDASGEWKDVRARSCASWMAMLCNLPLPEGPSSHLQRPGAAPHAPR